MVKKIWIAVIAIVTLTFFSLSWFMPARDFLFIWLVAINVVAFFVYWYDKAIAGGRAMRVPEALLHALALAGGWPFALISMRLFHHKTGTNSKKFRNRFWVCVIVNSLVLGWFYWFYLR